MKKEVNVTYDAQFKVNRELRSRYVSPLIKWYDTNMSKSERYRYGLMGYDEFVAWQQEAAAKQAAEEEAEATTTASSTSDSGAGTSYGHTFWEDDEGDRQNISDKEYMEFLAKNNIDIGSKSALGYL